MRVFVAVLILALALQALHANAETSQEDFDRLVGEILGRVESLRERRVNVEELAARLGEAVKLWESGDRGGAVKILEEVKLEVEGLEEEAWIMEARFYLSLAVKVLALLSIPPLTYYGLPRVYLRVWYNLRRGWLVRSAPRR